MTKDLAIAGVICVVLAAGHTAVGMKWVLPRLSEERISETPFGTPAMTAGMIRVTWYIVTIFVLAVAGILLRLAWGHPDARSVVLRGFAAMWLASALLSLWQARRRLSSLRRLPAPALFLAVSLLCWFAGR
jgi:hypothetical protein